MRKSRKRGRDRSSGRRFRAKLIVAGAIFVTVVITFAIVTHWRMTSENSSISPQLQPVSKKTSSPAGSALSSTARETATIPLSNRRSWKQIDDPRADGWDTEVFHIQAKKQLNQLCNLLFHPNHLQATQFASLATDDFICGRLIPVPLHQVVNDGTFLVERSAPSRESAESLPPESARSEKLYRGLRGMAEAVKEAYAPLASADDTRFAFKIVRVQPHENGITTHQHLSLMGRTAKGMFEQHAKWIIHWKPGSQDSLPKLQSIFVEDFQQVRTENTEGPLFSDCTEAALGNNACYSEQLLHGINHWLQRIPDYDLFTPFGTPGFTLGDANGDGLDDLYLCQEPGLPNKLFLQNQDSTLRDVSAEWGVDFQEDSRSALLIDLDNDGDQDLVVAILRNLVVASNDGQRRFQIETILPLDESTTSLTAVDYDQDGRLDLYACVYAPNQSFQAEGGELIGAANVLSVYHDANNGGANSLFRNEISAGETWRFEEVTHQVGLDVNNRRWTFAAAWEDFDNDGDQDLYVANDYGRNNLFRNDVVSGKRVFVDVASQAGAEDSASGMSVTWGDYDRDGWMDVYVSNMFSAAGSRVTRQTKFKPEISAELRSRFQRFARGNTLLRNVGYSADSPRPGFSDVSTTTAVTMGRWAWGSNFVDLNNDGWDDLVIANGYITADDSGDL